MGPGFRPMLSKARPRTVVPMRSEGTALHRAMPFALAITALVGISGTTAGADAAECLGVAATIVGTPYGESIVGTPGDDVISAQGGSDTILGGGGNDLLCGNGGDDDLRGGAGSDRLAGGEGADLHEGGKGFDVADYSERGARLWVSIDGSRNDGERDEGDLVGRSVESVVGGSRSDRIWGSRDADTLVGGGGGDLIDGAEGDDTLLGGSGRDTLLGGPGEDLSVGGAGDDLESGDGSDDTFTQFPLTTYRSTEPPLAISDDGERNDSSISLPPGEIRDINVRVDIEHGSPGDLVLILRSPTGATVTLADRITENRTQFVGTTFDSEAFTRITNVADHALAGRFHPEGSLDRTYRGTEAGGTWLLRVIDDVPGDRGTLNRWSLEIAGSFDRGDGADTIAGGDGLHDLVDYSARTGSVSVSLDGSPTDGQTGEGDDVRSNLEQAMTGSGDDSLVGNAWGNDLRGWTGDDEVSGGDGDDMIDGGVGFDTLDGNAGANTCLNGESVANCVAV